MPSNTREVHTVSDQEPPVVQVVGRIAATAESTDGGTSTKFLLHVGWSRKTFQVSNRGLKLLRTLDIRVIDDAADYTV